MLNPRAYLNSRPDGFGVLEIPDDQTPDAPRRFVPLRRTELAGEVTGPLATLRHVTLPLPGGEEVHHVACRSAAFTPTPPSFCASNAVTSAPSRRVALSNCCLR